MVPTARFELAHLTALAPQASVSTNSTTSATFKKILIVQDAARYFGAAPGAGCAGAEAGAGAGAVGCAVDPGAGAAAGADAGVGVGADSVVPVAPASAGVDGGAVSPGLGAVGTGIVCVTPDFALSLFSPIVSRIVFGAAATVRVPT